MTLPEVLSLVSSQHQSCYITIPEVIFYCYRTIPGKYLLLQNHTGSGIYCFRTLLEVIFIVPDPYRMWYLSFRTLPEVVFIFSEPYRKYTIWCRAFNLKNEGNSSTPIQVMSDVAGPGKMLLHEDNVNVHTLQPKSHL
jgi:hypothetical protein